MFSSVKERVFLIEALDLISVTTNIHTSRKQEQSPYSKEAYLLEREADKCKQISKYCVHCNHKCHVKKSKLEAERDINL